VDKADERVAIFIDGSNFYHCLKEDFGTAAIDFGKLAECLANGRQLLRIYYYNAPVNAKTNPEQYKRQQQFFDRLRNTPYLSLRLGRLETRRGSTVEKGVDIAIAVDMLKMAFRDLYDTAILISGDGDFAYAAEAVKDLGKHVENAMPKSGISFHLKSACDRFILLDENFLRECFIGDSSRSRSK
jgi:uncharacterized LabA/DUF88 family protein